MKEEILKKLQEIEKEKNIKIIYAVESGSRMWNFASQNSDYDIRFLYINNLKHYLSINDKKDFILFMDNEKKLDFSGWDIKKALGLLLKSNMSLYEWINSPIVYINTEEMKNFTSVAQNCWDKKKLIYSYIHLANNNYRAYVLNKPEIKLKKYLYILRTIAACMWLEKNFGNDNSQLCPISIDALSEMIKEDSDYIYSLLQKIIEAKKEREEVILSQPDEQANKWIEEKIRYYKDLDKELTISKSKYKRKKAGIEALLDTFFYDLISKRGF